MMIGFSLSVKAELRKNGGDVRRRAQVRMLVYLCANSYIEYTNVWHNENILRKIEHNMHVQTQKN